jgi:hypothetical protein
METSPGRGWTIFQRRIDGSENFYRTWAEYKSGFGNLSGEFWLGLDKIYRLSANGQNLLRIDLDTFENGTAYAVYESFSVGSERDAYVLNIGSYSGNNQYIDINSSTVGRNFVLGGGGLISQGRLLGHCFHLKLYRLSLVYKLLGGG